MVCSRLTLALNDCLASSTSAGVTFLKSANSLAATLATWAAYNKIQKLHVKQILRLLIQTIRFLRMRHWRLELHQWRHFYSKCFFEFCLIFCCYPKLLERPTMEEHFGGWLLGRQGQRELKMIQSSFWFIHRHKLIVIFELTLMEVEWRTFFRWPNRRILGDFRLLKQRLWFCQG